MSDAVRAFTPIGNDAFTAYLGRLPENPSEPPPWDLLENHASSRAPGFVAHITHQPHGDDFADRHQFGAYLSTVLGHVPRASISLNHQVWNWLTLYYFDQLCPADASGKRRLHGSLEVYLLDERYKWTRYYRHFVRAPWLAVSLHPLTSRVILLPLRHKGPPLTGRGELFEQVCGRLSSFRSPSVMRAVYELYFDETLGRPRAGAGAREGGSPNRLGMILRQFDRTYDLEWGQEGMVVSLLPKEFARWSRK